MTLRLIPVDYVVFTWLVGVAVIHIEKGSCGGLGGLVNIKLNGFFFFLLL